MSKIRTIETPRSDIYLVGKASVEGPCTVDGENIATVHSAIDSILKTVSERCGNAFYADRTDGQSGRIFEYSAAPHRLRGGVVNAVYRVPIGTRLAATELPVPPSAPDAEILFFIAVFNAAHEFAEDYEALVEMIGREGPLLDIDEAIERVFESAETCARAGDYDLTNLDTELAALLTRHSLRRNAAGELEPAIDVRNVAPCLTDIGIGVKALTFEYSTDDRTSWIAALDYVGTDDDGSLYLVEERDWATAEADLTVRQIEYVDAILWVALKKIEGCEPFSTRSSVESSS
jgi:hypothetical protein